MWLLSLKQRVRSTALVNSIKIIFKRSCDSGKKVLGAAELSSAARLARPFHNPNNGHILDGCIYRTTAAPHLTQWQCSSLRNR